MEILVCVKQVPDDSVEIHLDPATMTPDISGAEPQSSAFDTYALELAVRYTEAHEGTVTVASLGPDDNKTSLKNCLAVGAKKAFHISDEGIENADPTVTANAILAAIPKMEEANGAKFDLILVGRESTDYIDGEVGEILAEKLGLPFVTNAVEVNPVDAGINVKKELDAGYYIMEAAAPAVLTVSKPDYDPRYPTIKSKLAARKVEIPTIGAADLAMDNAAKQAKIEYLGFEEPVKKEAGVKIQEDEPADAVAKAMEVMLADKVL